MLALRLTMKRCEFAAWRDVRSWVFLKLSCPAGQAGWNLTRTEFLSSDRHEIHFFGILKSKSNWDPKSALWTGNLSGDRTVTNVHYHRHRISLVSMIYERLNFSPQLKIHLFWKKTGFFERSMSHILRWSSFIDGLSQTHKKTPELGLQFLSWLSKVYWNAEFTVKVLDYGINKGG